MWCRELTHWKRPWCWERLKTGREWDNRGWDGWMASPTRWTRVWVGSRSWWWTGRPGMLQSMGLQRVGHNWVTELNCPLISRNHYNWFEIIILKCTICFEFYEGCRILYSAFWVLFQTPARILIGTMKFTQPGKYGFTCVKKCTPSTGKWNPIPKVLMITRILSKSSLWNKQISSHKLWWHF